MRKLISIVVLAVYSVVISHDFIPHHHHSGHSLSLQTCELERENESCRNHAGHTDHSNFAFMDCCSSQHQHAFCSFDEETVLTKWISLSNLFLPSTEIVFAELSQPKPTYTDAYLPFKIKDPHCRAIQLRGPPQFS